MSAPTNDGGGWVAISVLERLFRYPATLSGVISQPVVGIQMILGHSAAAEVFLEFHKLRSNRNKKVEEEEALAQGKGYHRPATIEVLQFSRLKKALLSLWRTLGEAYANQGKRTEEDDKVLESSVPYLMQVSGEDG